MKDFSLLNPLEGLSCSSFSALCHSPGKSVKSLIRTKKIFPLISTPLTRARNAAKSSRIFSDTYPCQRRKANVLLWPQKRKSAERKSFAVWEGKIISWHQQWDSKKKWKKRAKHYEAKTMMVNYFRSVIIFPVSRRTSSDGKGERKKCWAKPRAVGKRMAWSCLKHIKIFFSPSLSPIGASERFPNLPVMKSRKRNNVFLSS